MTVRDRQCVLPRSSRNRDQVFFERTEARSSLQAMESAVMFQTIDEQIERTEGGRPTLRARMVRFAGIAAVLGVFFAGLYFAIVSFE